ncbi:Coproporphyrinogen III oxidase, oxygen-independent [hydrothermal vent metagenome]|uniref:Oxygen-independent coproporphyrinogen III oxidase n=1 Tax=hydrothermal vent metagenome TaxID=652676 RepID=A0A3B1AXE1_9ZZZZ
MQPIEINTDLIRSYDKSGPRYTSYPTAVQFSSAFSATDYKKQIALSNLTKDNLSLYFHIPFCDTICYYCGCNKIVTKNRKRAEPYLERLHKEIELQAGYFDNKRVVTQLHWGGGTPTFISPEQMQQLMEVTQQHFNLLNDDSGEYSIEIDPREANEQTIILLRKLGFNRMSLGVQDFNPEVQKAVNRIQSFKETQEVIVAARETGFHSISIDLIYGLPHQTVASFTDTLQTIIELDPDRLSIFNYAHLPEMFKTQRQINSADIPAPQVKLEILQQAIQQLAAAGYVYIGMDHFAKPDDELAIAQNKHNLYRNFQGYSTHADCDLVGLGITSIGKVANCYSQNVKTMDEYYELIDNNQLPVFRGIELNADDLLRREVINQLICHYYLDFSSIEAQFKINFSEYFSNELQKLKNMQQDGLLVLGETEITVQPIGYLLIRNICMVFDRYLGNAKNRFSKVI